MCLPSIGGFRCLGSEMAYTVSINNTSQSHLMKIQSKTSLSLRKFLLSALVAAPLATLPAPLWALPATTGNVTSNSVATTFTQVGTTLLQITDTTTNRLVLKWTEFGGGPTGATNTIALGDTINWTLPSASSAVLNMVSSGATIVNGALVSNGSIFILNPAGITLSSTATVNAAGLGLSTIPESEFFFVANGNLSYVGTATQPVTVAVSNAGSQINVGATGNVFVSGLSANVSGNIQAGTLTVNTQNGAVNLSAANALNLGTAATSSTAGNGNLVVNSTGGAVNLAQSAQTTVFGGTATITSVGPTASGAITSTNLFAVGDTQNNSTLTLNSGLGAITLGTLGTFGTPGTAGVSGNTKRVAINLTSGPASITSAGRIQLNTGTVTGNLNVQANASSIDSGSGVTVTGGTIALLTQAVNSAISFVGPGDLTFSSLVTAATTASNVTLTSTTGAIALPAAAIGGNLTVTAQTNISQAAGALTVNQAGLDASTNRTATFDAVTGSIVLNTATNDFTRLVLKSAPSGASVVDATGVTLGNGTSTTGVTSVTAASVVLGTASGDALRFGSELSINTVAANGTITDLSDNITALGKVTLASGSGAITLDGGIGLGFNLKNSFGQLNATTTGALTVYEMSTLNLGTISAASLRAVSTGGDIINTGRLQITGATVVGAGTAAAPGSISLNYAAGAGAGNVLAGTISILDDFAFVSNAGPNGATIANYLARDLTVVNEATTTIDRITGTAGNGITGNLTVTALGAGNDIILSAPTNVGGNVVLNAADAITATSPTNAISNVTVTAGGIVAFNSASNLTVNGTLTAVPSTAPTASFTSNGGTLTIGSYTSDYTGLTTFTTTANRAITDSVAGVRVFGPVTFASTGGITVNRAGHSFGGVTLTTGNNGSATLVESGTLRLVRAGIHGTGSLTATSTSGDIFQDAASLGVTVGTGSATFNAPLGRVLLDDNVGTVNVIAGRINVTAAGEVMIKQNSATVLGNITTGGKLTVDLTGPLNNLVNSSVSQFAGTRINAFDQVTLTTAGTGAITIGNTGNRMGGIVATTGSGDITLTENTTLNMRSVTTSGNLTATSEASNIIDTTDATLAGLSLNRVIVGGTSTLSAPTGSITLGLATSNYAIVGFTSAGNVTVLDSAGDTTLGASSIGGSLDVTNSAAGQTIRQSGALLVNGGATFVNSQGGIDLSNGGNQFGGVRFVAGAAGAILTENTTFNLRGGSNSAGPVQISTNGNFITTAGGSFINGNLTISALGTIIPSTGSLFVTGILTVFSPTLKDLSALSKGGNLAGKDPQNLGSGTYVAPSP